MPTGVKLTDRKIAEIRRLWRLGIPGEHIADMCEVHRNCVPKYCRGIPHPHGKNGRKVPCPPVVKRDGTVICVECEPYFCPTCERMRNQRPCPACVAKMYRGLVPSATQGIDGDGDGDLSLALGRQKLRRLREVQRARREAAAAEAKAWVESGDYWGMSPGGIRVYAQATANGKTRFTPAESATF